MSTDPNRFLPKTKQILEKRANSICSNPHCNALTSGPHTEDNLAINLGEAAHIKGANLGSKRYDAFMLPEQRANITNGIWLCGKCAKLIDSDEKRYTQKLLYKWKRDHERTVSDRMTGETWEKKIDLLLVEKAFESENPAALQIAIDKPQFWEYLLTIELLREKTKIGHMEYDNLARGVIYKPTQILDKAEYIKWFRQSIENIRNIVTYFSVITNLDLPKSWGEPSVPGDALEIKAVADKIGAGYRYLLDWEIDAHYTIGPKEFEKVREGMKGWTKAIFLELSRISVELSKPFKEENPSGEYTINLTMAFPSNLDQVSDDFMKAAKSLC